MKNRKILTVTAGLCLLLLLVPLCVAFAEGADALPQGKQLRIDDASFDPGSGILTVKWTNTASVAATGTEFRIHPLDADGEPVVIGEGYVEDILLEERVLHTSVTAEPGQTVTSDFQAGSDYPDAAVMNVAVDRIEWTEFGKDGDVLGRTVLELPDDRMCWYSTRDNAYLPGPENESPYAMPAEDVLDAAAGVHLGITVIPVPGELADAYGFACGGMMIVSVEEDSPADAAGLEPRDLIYSVNGIRYAEEPYFIALGCADLAAGKPVMFLFERENEPWETALETAP